jgi:hypothetical protein
MALRKCPGCKNIIAAETESCPICGCNPRTRRLRKYVVLSVAMGTTVFLFQEQLRQHIPALLSPRATQAQTPAPPK